LKEDLSFETLHRVGRIDEIVIVIVAEV